ncbi:metallo-mystery pair system four-Cys motif protein [Colwellia sp. 1_MG-2023]|uniref:MbnP family copper-binding protein n=1 Tax=Colwellia sp. 1_MG-2023 TaxID=3062649 RepID=UPI0026E1F127|nr:MbnP family copper-binding protein [Colwellia sp. 1_MG-2023]MDO6444598.1 metallo-mystery pair system four-Cys motif protein [Colwellia sp. 1_MG-2023]
MDSKKTVYLFMMLFVFGCSKNNNSAILMFEPIYNGQIIECNNKINHQNKAWLVNQLQFFISQVQLQNRQGNWQNMALAKTTKQTENTALLGSTCQGAEFEHWQLNFKDDFSLADFQAVRFSLGVPFEQNHLNPLQQPSPLNDSSMFWIWQTGHKFLRLEMSSGADDWLFHLGSTGCKSQSVMRAPNDACLYPNVFQFQLPLGKSNTIAFDLSKLIGELPLAMATSCQSEHDNPACRPLFTRLIETGKQAVFRVSIDD